jgi:hypothetical protein
MRGEHVLGSPYLITVDRKVPDITEPSSPRMSAGKDVPRNLPEGRRHKVLFRVVDFIAVKMLLTDDGELKHLPSEIKVTAKHIPEKVTLHSSVVGTSDISVSCDTGSGTEEYGMKCRTVTNKGKRQGSFVTSSLSAEIRQGPSQNHKPKRRNLDFLRDGYRKVALLCSFFASLNSTHGNFQLLNSAEQVLDGRPVRLTEKTFSLIEDALKCIKPETYEYFMNPCTETKTPGRKVLKIYGASCSAGVSDDCRQESLRMKCKCMTSRLHKMKNTERSGIDIMNLSKLIPPFAPNLLAVQREREIHRSIKLNTAVTFNDISVYDFTSSQSLTIRYYVNSGINLPVCAVNGLNRGTEFDDNIARNKFEKELCVGALIKNPPRQISEYFILFTIQSGKELEIMSKLNISEDEAQEEYAVLTKGTDTIKVTNKEPGADQISDFTVIPRHLEANQQNVVMKTVSQRNCFVENENRTNESDECYDLRTKTCCVNNTYVQDASRPVQGVSICKHSELQLEDEANCKIGFNVNIKETNTEIISTNYFIKIMGICMNESTPSHAEKNMNTRSKQQTGTVSVASNINDNFPITEIKDEDTVFRDDQVWHKATQMMETGAPVNVKYNFRRINNINVYTLLPEILRQPNGNDPLKLHIKCGQREATYVSLIAGVTFDPNNRVVPVPASSPSNNDLFIKSAIFTDLEDILSQEFAAFLTSTSNGHQGEVFHLRPSDTASESHPGDILDYLDAIDFDPILDATNLEEALTKLDQALEVTKEKRASGNEDKTSNMYVRAREKIASPSPKSKGTTDSTAAKDNVVHFDIRRHGEMLYCPPAAENRSYSKSDFNCISFHDLPNYVKQILDNDEIRNDSNKSGQNNEYRGINKSVSSKEFRTHNTFQNSANE